MSIQLEEATKIKVIDSCCSTAVKNVLIYRTMDTNKPKAESVFKAKGPCL